MCVNKVILDPDMSPHLVTLEVLKIHSVSTNVWVSQRVGLGTLPLYSNWLGIHVSTISMGGTEQW